MAFPEETPARIGSAFSNRGPEPLDLVASLSAAGLANAVRIMNCCYSNLIEGHNTTPRETALRGQLDATGPARSRVARLCRKVSAALRGSRRISTSPCFAMISALARRSPKSLEAMSEKQRTGRLDAIRAQCRAFSGLLRTKLEALAGTSIVARFALPLTPGIRDGLLLWYPTITRDDDGYITLR